MRATSRWGKSLPRQRAILRRFRGVEPAVWERIRLPRDKTRGSQPEVAKPKKQITAAPKDSGAAMEQLEKPAMNWKVIGLIGLLLDYMMKRMGRIESALWITRGR